MFFGYLVGGRIKGFIVLGLSFGRFVRGIECLGRNEMLDFFIGLLGVFVRNSFWF